MRSSVLVRVATLLARRRSAAVVVVTIVGLLATTLHADAQGGAAMGESAVSAAAVDAPGTSTRSDVVATAVATRPVTAGRPGAMARRAEARGRQAPFSIALMVGDARSLTPQEQSLAAMLRGNGHSVTPFTVTARPRVNARNNPGIDLLLFSPSFVYSDLYHPAQRHSLPMLDMTRNSWYRRYVLPWNDEIAGPRFSAITDTSRRVRYDDAGVIPWGGRRVGAVRVLRRSAFSGGAPMRRAINHSTRGDAQFFLRHVSDTGAESAIGVYVPRGSTITKPAPTRGGERRRTSRAPWLGLIVFNDDFGDGDQYRRLTPAGEDLFEAAMHRLVNP